MNSSITKRQREALQIAVNNGGVIQRGGLDGDGVRVDVLINLTHKGLLERQADDLNWVDFNITDAGRAALANKS